MKLYKFVLNTDFIQITTHGFSNEIYPQSSEKYQQQKTIHLSNLKISNKDQWAMNASVEARNKNTQLVLNAAKSLFRQIQIFLCFFSVCATIFPFRL